MEIQPGTYKAKLVDYGMSETSKGDAQIVLKFNVETEDGIVPMTKFLSLKEGKAREFSYRAMSACGFDGSPVESIAGGKGTGCFDMVNPVDVVCQMESDGKGGSVCRISFINKPGGGFGKQILPAEAANKVSINFAAEMKGLGIELGQGTRNTDDIPF